MTTHSPTTPPQQLQRVLQERQVELGAALCLVEQLQTLSSSLDPRNAPLFHSLRGTIDRTVASAGTLQSLADQVRQSGALPTPLAEVVFAQEQLLERLLARTQTLMQRLRMERQGLIPQVDDDTRRRQMQNAYQTSLQQR